MDLKVELVGDEIVVSLPGTDMTVAFRRATDGSGLRLARTWIEPPSTSLETSKFRLIASEVALAKARELGWIV
jgi:hypothetical protein